MSSLEQFLKDESVRLRKIKFISFYAREKNVDNNAVSRFSRGHTLRMDTILELMKKGAIEDPLKIEGLCSKGIETLRQEIKNELIKELMPKIIEKSKLRFDDKLRKKIVDVLKYYQTSNNKAGELIRLLENDISIGF